jgi:hypothetical protein
MSNNSNKHLAKSPNRNTFQKEKYLKRQAEAGKTPENDSDTADMLDYYFKIIKDDMEKEVDPEWQKNNLEYDLRSTDWVVEKTKADETYAQNLYAALCNNEFQKLDVIPILKEEKWSCSWRYAGGILADMREQGDYIDWYCSGIRSAGDDGESIDTGYIKRKYVSESVVTDEIREDLKQLGWIVVTNDDDQIY